MTLEEFLFFLALNEVRKSFPARKKNLYRESLNIAGNCQMKNHLKVTKKNSTGSTHTIHFKALVVLVEHDDPYDKMDFILSSLILF